MSRTHFSNLFQMRNDYLSAPMAVPGEQGVAKATLRSGALAAGAQESLQQKVGY